MWSALEHLALRESLPTPLAPGETVHDILISGQVSQGRHSIRHLGRRRSKRYILKQFYSLDTDAFLRWQSEARFTAMPQTPGYNWPSEEWRGGLIYPYSGGIPLDEWLKAQPRSMSERMCVATQLASQLQALHSVGITHRGLSPASLRVNGTDVSITDFGHATYAEWDDLWADSTRRIEDNTCASPEALLGNDSGPLEDVYCFGSLLHMLLVGKAPYGSIRSFLRKLVPSLIPPNISLDDTPIPEDIHQLSVRCLANDPLDRPSMATVATVLSRYCERMGLPMQDIQVPGLNSPTSTAEKVMVFIKDDHKTISLFDSVLRHPENASAMYMFVALIPNHLPSGHLERFKASLFRKISQGLVRCRGTDIQWSLRVLEETVPEVTARHLIEMYGPDRVMVGNTNGGARSFPGRRGFEAHLKGILPRIDSVS